MIARHRKKAFLGLGLWVASILLIIASVMWSAGHPDSGSHFLRDIKGVLVVAGFFANFACFFWSSYHLALAKGYSGGIAAFGILGPLAQIAVFIGLLTMKDRCSNNPVKRTARRSTRPQGSNIEHIVACRRNALIGIGIGLGGLVLGMLLVIFRIGIFADHQNELILGMFVIGCGYIGIISGCWWWLKAKNWIDAVVIIALMPLAIFFVPFVRLLVAANPFIFLAVMIMMSLILLVVVAVLPDKSGWVGRKRWRVRD